MSQLRWEGWVARSMESKYYSNWQELLVGDLDLQGARKSLTHNHA